MTTIHQLVCTHCTYGTSAFERRQGEMAGQVLGYSVRASSLTGDELRKCYRDAEPNIYYYLPPDSPAAARLQRDASSAPRRFLFVPSANGRQVLGQVCYRQTDTGGRPGSYFAHLLLDDGGSPQQRWPLTDFLKLWGAPLWIAEDSPHIPFVLGPRGSLREMLDGRRPAIDDGVLLGLLTTPSGRLFDDPSWVVPDRLRERTPPERSRLFAAVLAGFVEVLAGRYQSLLLVAEPGLAALVFYGVARLVPPGVVQLALGFSTFEPRLDRALPALAATSFHDPANADLPPEMYRSAAFSVNTYSDRATQNGPAETAYALAIVNRLVERGWEAVDQALDRLGSAGARTAAEWERLLAEPRKPPAVAAPPPTARAQPRRPRPPVAAQGFDPYHKWLGIPSRDQPAHYYRLLGVEPFEADPDVISNAADQRMAHVDTFRTGPHGDSARQMLNEIASARVCLMDPERKAAYDAQLRQRLAVPRVPQPPPVSQRTVGSTLDRYLLLEQLGNPWTGQVFKARHRTLGRVVAIKVLSEEARASAEMVRRFRRKVKILARLDHPNLVRAYDAGQSAGTFYLVMEYVDGQDLATLLAQCGPPPLPYAVNYIAQAAAGLGHAHANGVYHRDLKPSNLLLDRQGRIRVIGLGMARVEPGQADDDASAKSALTRPNQVIGTPNYMAPEQAVDSHHTDHRADIYSLGCVLYAILTGGPPYPLESRVQQAMAHRWYPIPPLRALRADVSSSLEAVYQKMLAKKPEDRFQSMAEVIAALATC